MTMKKFPLWFLLLTIMVSVPIAAAADTGGDNGINQTNASPSYYIAIDPIGNHTVGDVFFINGTTNLGTWEKSFGLDIAWFAFNPSGFSKPFYTTIASIQPGENGTGTWSAEIIPSQWEIYILSDHHPTSTQFGSAYPGEYMAYVSSPSPLGPSVITQQTFFLVPVENNRTPEPVNMTVAVPGKSENIPVPTRQNAPVLWYLPVIAAGAVTIWYRSNNQKRRKE